MTSGARFASRTAAAAAVAMLVVIAGMPTAAHKPITSRFTYNADVFPIFRDRCGRCHVAAGPAPMSLLNYKESVPWAESIREELVAEKMPPWFVDPAGARISGGHAVSSREIDTIITWVTGGTPEGDPATRPAAVVATNEWPAGPPDVVLPMDTEYTVPAEVAEQTRDFVLDTGFASRRWVTLADLRPGTPAIVRDATIAVENGPLLAAWVPGESPARTTAPSAFLVPAHARLQVRIHYRKPWQDGGKPRSDRSSVGLYFAADAPDRRAIHTMVLDLSSGVATRDGHGVHADGPVTVLAIRPQLNQAYVRIDVAAVLPSGARVSLLRLHRPRPEWRRRYSLAVPVDVPAGSRFELDVVPAAPDPDDPQHVAAGPLQVAIEFVHR
jgi:hypothetical protein